MALQCAFLLCLCSSASQVKRDAAGEGLGSPVPDVHSLTSSEP